ncbi:MAG: TonB-dependent receptor, partial [Acidobacteriota bacterium]
MGTTLVLLGVLHAAFGWAQAPVTVTGRVVTGAGLSPVVGAVISGDGVQAATDSTGGFVVVVPQGRLRLEVSAPGFLNQRIDLPATPEMAPLEVVLVPTQDFRESVTVSGTTAARAPTASTIDVPPLAVKRVAGAGDNIFRALQTLPGVNATDDFGSRLAVRGGGPDQNLTVMDGVEIHNPYRLFGLTSAFNPEIVEGFELTAGGFGAKYGDRLSSILQVNNRPGRRDTALAGTAALSLTDTNLVLEGRLPGGATGSWLVTGRRTYYDLVARRFTDNDLPSFEDLQTKVVWEPHAGQQLTFFALRSRERTDAAFGSSTSTDRAVIGDGSRNDVAALAYARPLGSRASSRTVAAWYVYTDGLDFNGSFQNDAQRSNVAGDSAFSRTDVVFTRSLSVRDVSLRHDASVQLRGGHFLETGFDVHALRTSWGWTITGDRNPSAANGSSIRGGAGLPSLLQSTRDTTRAAAWLQDRFLVGARLRLEPGLRIDRSGFSGETVASPRLGVSYELTPLTRLRGAVGRYTQSPGYEKLLQADYFVDLTSASGRTLSSERSTHVLGALEHVFAPSVTGRTEFYYKRFDQIIVGRLETPEETAARVAQYNFPPALSANVPTAPIITSIPVNGASGRAYGLDVYIEKKVRS